MDQISTGLEQLRFQIERWRESKQSPRERMPTELWERAISLCTHKPPTRIAKELGLSYPSLKKRLPSHSKEPPGKFLQLPTGLGLSSQVNVELRHGSGKELCISGDPSSMLPVIDRLLHWLASPSS
jgi:hypothetical protein